MSSTMKAYCLAGLGNPVALEHRPIPKPQRGQLLVRNLATSVNFHDLLNFQGVIPNVSNKRVPFSDNCGEIVERGPDCGHWEVGQRVLANFFPDWMDGQPTPSSCARVYGDNIDGFLQEYSLVDAGSVVQVPAHLSNTEAATLACAGLTAWRSVADDGRVRAGDVVVVQGTGGVSMFALQFAKALGARVFVCSSSRKKLDVAAGLGADWLHNYRDEPDWAEALMSATHGRGADLIVEVGGADTIERSIRAVKFNGLISVIGVRSGFGLPAQVSLETVLINNLNIRGMTVGCHRQLQEMLALIDELGIKPVLDHCYPIEDFNRAMAAMSGQQHIGKIAIDTSDWSKVGV